MQDKMTTADADTSLKFLTFEIYSLLTGKVHIVESRAIHYRHRDGNANEEIDWDHLFEITDYLLMGMGIDIYEYRCDMTPRHWVTARVREWGLGVRCCRPATK